MEGERKSITTGAGVTLLQCNWLQCIHSQQWGGGNTRVHLTCSYVFSPKTSGYRTVTLTVVGGSSHLNKLNLETLLLTHLRACRHGDSRSSQMLAKIHHHSHIPLTHASQCLLAFHQVFRMSTTPTESHQADFSHPRLSVADPVH